MLPVSYPNELPFYKAVPTPLSDTPGTTRTRSIPQEPTEEWRKTNADICEGRNIEIGTPPKVPSNGIRV